MSGERPASFTETEGRALDLLTRTIASTKLMDRQEDRIVDPVGATRELFGCLEAAEAFVERLVREGAIAVCHAPDVLRCKDPEGRDSLLTFVVSQDRWLIIADAPRVPDPPFEAEERKARAAIARKREHRKALADRKAALERELEAVARDLSDADASLAADEKTVGEFAEWRRKLGAICSS